MLEQQIFNGLLLGSTYALFALGLSLVLGGVNLLNFAQGEALMIAAFSVFVLATTLQAPFPVVLLGSILAATLVTLITYLLSFRLVNKDYWMAGALSTIGVGIFIQTLATRIWGTEQRQVPDVSRLSACSSAR